MSIEDMLGYLMVSAADFDRVLAGRPPDWGYRLLAWKARESVEVAQSRLLEVRKDLHDWVHSGDMVRDSDTLDICERLDAALTEAVAAESELLATRRLLEHAP